MFHRLTSFLVMRSFLHWLWDISVVFALIFIPHLSLYKPSRDYAVTGQMCHILFTICSKVAARRGRFIFTVWACFELHQAWLLAERGAGLVLWHCFIQSDYLTFPFCFIHSQRTCWLVIVGKVQVLLRILMIAQFYSSVPVGHDRKQLYIILYYI